MDGKIDNLAMGLASVETLTLWTHAPGCWGHVLAHLHPPFQFLLLCKSRCSRQDGARFKYFGCYGIWKYTPEWFMRCTSWVLCVLFLNSELFSHGVCVTVPNNPPPQQLQRNTSFHLTRVLDTESLHCRIFPITDPSKHWVKMFLPICFLCLPLLEVRDTIPSPGRVSFAVWITFLQHFTSLGHFMLPTLA